ncbi:UbiX family flavin prenyltransferase [Streptomyces poonensis]|uniref:Flavin prenyltransferase UbiX n=1 Tax=Streptomyces poonensis TaxID=68255 RepID=A0A918Q8J3_9ACTN|nr:UbiX family flavin prenyltransferase [Streptomyces poonensis]GGZ37923.1 flavin prenyltransferase UbiX [Streptomyces poonensis]GLJ91103.1 flavin prenyltransferase UbiX [Streptomyces poonensis]
MTEQRTITLAVTGAGGTRMARHVLSALERDDRVAHVDLLVSPNGRKLVAHEFGGAEDGDPVTTLLGRPTGKVTVWDSDTWEGPHTSGSYPSWGMIVVPCSLGTVGRIAQGQATALIERAADICLKERRPLVLCVRETPFNLIHLRNMAQVTEAGGIVYPMIPTYYNLPETVEQMFEEFTERLLGFVGLDQTDYYTWQEGGSRASVERAAARTARGADA